MPRAVDPAERRQRLILYSIAIAGLLALAAAVAFVALAAGGGDGPGDARAAMEKAGCTFKTYPSEGRDHTNNLEEKVKYKTFPPTSGKHYFQPAIWDFYTTPVSQLQLVHNLEHGGIVIQYGNSAPAGTVDRLTEFYREDPTGLVVAPLPALKDKIALTAWTRLATCPRFDEKAFSAFRDAYRFKGPERLPEDALQPGVG